MKPTRYELLIDQSIIYLRGFAAETAKGFFNVEAHPYRDGRSLPALRTQGEKLARRFGVQFVDRTVQS